MKKLEFKYQTIILNSIKNTYDNELIRKENINKTYEQKLISKKQYICLLNDVEYNISYYEKIMYKYLKDSNKNNEFVEKYNNQKIKTI